MDRLNLAGTQAAGTYELGAAIAQTHHTITYAATHLQSGASYMVRVLEVAAGLDATDREVLLQRITAAAAATRRAGEDNHVVWPPHQTGSITLDDGRWVPFVAYPELSGHRLSDVLDEETGLALPPRSFEEAMELMEPVALALTSAHEHGVIHGGLSPATVWVLGDARSPLADVRVVDFGIASAVAGSLRGPGPISGRSPAQLTVTASFNDSHFAAPEQVDFTGHDLSLASDVYSLALVLAHLMSHGTDPRHAGDPAYYRATPAGRGILLAPALEDAFAAALARDPAERPKDVMDFWSALRGTHRIPARSASTLVMPGATDTAAVTAEHVAEEVTSTSPIAGEVATAPKRKSRQGLMFAAAGVFLVGGAAAIVATRPAPPPAGASDASMAPQVVEQGASSATEPEPATCPEGMAQIDAGQFFMGSDEVDALDFEKPAHSVSLSAYCIDKNEVTVAQYKACSDDGKCKRASKVNVWLDIEEAQRTAFDPLCNMNDPEGRANHPINCVTWHMAKDYCAVAGKRLPTEAEWEYAARGKDGRIYPWGDDEPTHEHLNACGAECMKWSRETGQPMSAMYAADDGFAHTAPVGSFPAGASQAGLHDVVGNVWEWVGDWYMPYTKEAQKDPVGPEKADKRVIRGGAWNGGHAAWVRPTFRYRDYADTKGYGIGFRCAMSLER